MRRRIQYSCFFSIFVSVRNIFACNTEKKRANFCYFCKTEKEIHSKMKALFCQTMIWANWKFVWITKMLRWFFSCVYLWDSNKLLRQKQKDTIDEHHFLYASECVNFFCVSRLLAISIAHCKLAIKSKLKSSFMQMILTSFKQAFTGLAIRVCSVHVSPFFFAVIFNEFFFSRCYSFTLDTMLQSPLKML